MTEQEARELCRRWLPAWTGNRPAELLQFYAESAYYQDPVNPAGLRGHGQLMPYFTKLLARNPDWTWEAEEILSTEKGFTLKWRAQFPGVGPVQGLDIVETEAGRITRNEVYFDTAQLKR